jgi:hypothetical protein
LHLPESEPLRRAGRGFVVRDLLWTVEKLRVIPPFETSLNPAFSPRRRRIARRPLKILATGFA